MMKNYYIIILLIFVSTSILAQKKVSVERYKNIAMDIRDGNMQSVKDILKDGYSVEPPSDFEFSLLTAAVMFDQITIAQYLIDNGADVNYENGSGIEKTSVLGYAMLAEYPLEYVKLLLKNGANPNYKEASGLYIIDKAFNTRDNRIIFALLNAGANVNNTTYIEDYKYSTLGLLLSLHYDYSAVKLLIDAGADVNSKIYYPPENITISVLDFAEYINQNSDIVKLLKSNGAKNLYNSNSSSSTKYMSLNNIFSYIGGTNTTNASKNYSSSYNSDDYSSIDLEIRTFNLDKSNYCNGSCDRYVITFNQDVDGPNEWDLSKNQIYVFRKHNGEWHSSSSLIGSYIAHDKNDVEKWAIKKYSN